MQENIKTYFLKRVKDDWESLSYPGRLWAMWICYYPPIPVGTEQIDKFQIPLQAWFLTKDGLSERSIWEFRRLQTVHFIQPWCGKMWGESSNWWRREGENIGFASFAQYKGTSHFYFSSSWGRLSAKGWRFNFDKNGNFIDCDFLWIS